MIHSELLQFTTLQSLVKYDDTIYVVILDNDSFRNLCDIPICTSWCQLNSICLHCIEIHNIYQCNHTIKTYNAFYSYTANTPGMRFHTNVIFRRFVSCANI